ncbi:MAG: MBL fold metallo-hydrolase [Stanieria sp.]
MDKRRTVPATDTNSLSCLPYGVGHSDEGVCLLVQMGVHRIILDCGLKNIELFQRQKTPPAEFVICSHAHVDHCRSIFALHQSFPQLPIYTSEVTAKLLSIYEQQPNDISWCQTVPWRAQIKLAEDLSFQLYPAGHLPGAAAILLTYTTEERNYKLLYTGDFSLSNFQLVEGLSLEDLRGIAPDILIVEGSYGTVRHSHRRQQEKQLMERIAQALAEGRNVLLPVPLIGLGQEILKLLRSHHQFTGRDLDIWVDGKIASACDLYLELLPQLPLAVQNFAKHQSLFWDERVCPRMRRLTNNQDLIESKLPCILLVDDTANLKQYLNSNWGDWLILISESSQKYLDIDFAQLANQSSSKVALETYLLAEHSDGRNTTQLIHNLRPQHVIFVHGSPSYLMDLTSLEELRNRYQLHSPSVGNLVELHLSDRFIQPATTPPSYYEGELNEVGSVITVVLPDTLINDSRWNNFADTGIVEARWQGEELVLRGVSQRELLSQNSEPKTPEDVDCCKNCYYYANQRCLNRISPLYGFKVIPEGCCPVFEPLSSEDSLDEH